VYPITPAYVLPHRGFTVRQEFDDLVITRRLFSFYFLASLFTVGLMNVTMIMSAIFSKQQHADGFHAYYLPVATVLASSLCFMLIQVINSEEIRLNEKRITVKHYPLPWPAKITIPWEAIAEISTEAVSSEHDKTTSIVTYNLNVKLKIGKQVTLISTVHHKDEIVYIEKQATQHLPEPPRLFSRIKTRFGRG